MKFLVTSAVGFTCSTLSIHLLVRGNEVIGIDNHNDYDSALRLLRLNPPC